MALRRRPIKQPKPTAKPVKNSNQTLRQARLSQAATQSARSNAPKSKKCC